MRGDHGSGSGIFVYLLLSVVCWTQGTDPHFTNQWAVHVPGGEEAARGVADDLGYHYKGPVSLMFTNISCFGIFMATFPCANDLM